jgi:penicillin-binding protein 1A
MGNGETGGAAALPIWIGFMEHALKNVPESWQETPEGLVSIIANDPSGKSSKELVYKEHLPPIPADEEKEEAVQEKAPVQDAKPKIVEKPAAPKPAEKPAAEKPVPPKPAEKKP